MSDPVPGIPAYRRGFQVYSLAVRLPHLRGSPKAPAGISEVFEDGGIGRFRGGRLPEQVGGLGKAQFLKI